MNSPNDGKGGLQAARPKVSTGIHNSITLVECQTRWQAEADRLYAEYLLNADERHLRAFDVHVAAMRRRQAMP